MKGSAEPTYKFQDDLQFVVGHWLQQRDDYIETVTFGHIFVLLALCQRLNRKLVSSLPTSSIGNIFLIFANCKWVYRDLTVTFFK